MPKAAELPIPAYRDVRLPRIGALGAFNVASLFMNNEPGWAYDNSDMSTLFQDSAGTTPVTAVGQPVGLQLDKKQGLVLGPEMWADASATFSGESSRISAGVYRVLSTAGVVSQVAVGGGTPGKAYEVTVTISSITGSLTTDFINTPTWTTTGVKRFIGILVGPNYTFKRSGVMDATISDISVKELAGTHRYQTTAASRLTFARVPVTGRRNLLTYTEQFDNAAWTKANGTISANVIAGPDGSVTADKLVSAAATAGTYIRQAFTSLAGSYTMTIYAKAAEAQFVQLLWASAQSFEYANFDLVNGVVGNATAASSSISPAGNGWYRISITSTLLASTGYFNMFLVSSGSAGRGAAYAGDGTAGAYAWGAQLELGSTDTNYQAVTSIYDITEAGVQTAYGLYYDGVDDFMVTPTITPGTDKVQVFAGVRKLSDAASGVPAELSANAGTNAGAFVLYAPLTAAATFAFGSRGDSVGTSNAISPPAFGAPTSRVITALGDISGDRSTLRVNGVLSSQNTADQGAGNYLAYPAYFGRRGGTTLPFSGYVFREIGRFGPNLDTMAISNTEKWINQATGAY